MKRLFACAAIAAGVSLTASAAYEDVTWLQYVEGDGGAYLTTDYTPNPAKDTITIDVELVADDKNVQTIFAARHLSTGVNTWSLLYLTDGRIRYDFGTDNGTSSRHTSTTTFPPGRYTIVLDRNGATVNGTPVTFDQGNYFGETFTPGGPLWMFAMYWGGVATNLSKMKLHSLRIDGEGSLHLYCPIKDAQGQVTVVDATGCGSVVTREGTGALKDGPEGTPPEVLVINSVLPVRYAGYGVPSASKVRVADLSTGKILKEGTDYTLDWTNTTHLGTASVKVKGLGKYTNQVVGSSSPMVAKLPAKYTPLEYIESTGQEYVDLEIQPTDKTGFFTLLDIAKPQANETYPSPFGARTGTGAYKLTGDLQATQWSYIPGFDTEIKCPVYGAHEIEVGSIQDKGIFRVDGNTKQFTQKPDLVLAANAYLFAFNDLKDKAADVTANPVHLAKMKLTAFALLEDGKVKRDLVPCKKVDGGERGLYDLVSKKFFRNASGTGGFTGDRELPPLPLQGLMLILK